MNLIMKVLIVLITLCFNQLMAQEDISGTWQGELDLGPDTKMKVQFIMQKEANGSWSALLNTPDHDAFKNIRADSVTYAENELKINITDLDGKYIGIFKAGSFEGEWFQAGTSIQLKLNPFEKKKLSEADKEMLIGEWHGKVEHPRGVITLGYRLEVNEENQLVGFRMLHEIGVERPVYEIDFIDGSLVIHDTKMKKSGISGEIIDKQFVGKVSTGSNTYDLTMNKEVYVQKTILNLPTEIKEQLMGEWHGELDLPGGVFPVVYRIEKNEAGEFLAYKLNNPTGNPNLENSKLLMKEITMEGGKLDFIPAIPLEEFSGELSGDEIIGELVDETSSIPLTLKKGKYTTPVYHLSLSSEAIEQLLGKWQGQIKVQENTYTLIFNFEIDDSGNHVGNVDIISQVGNGMNGLNISEASLSNGTLDIKIKNPRASYEGKLTEDEFNGYWTVVNTTVPLSLEKIKD